MVTNEAIYWYVLFVQTGAEERLVEQLKDKLSCENSIPFVPRKTCVFRRQGQKSLFQKICFPGYVFIESDKPAMEFFCKVVPIIHEVNGAYRFLYYNDRSNIAMREEERIALSRVFGKDRCIDISKGFKEGDSVEVISGPLMGQESIILRMNKGRQEATISVAMFGTLVPVSVRLEVIEKLTPDIPDIFMRQSKYLEVVRG